MDLTFVRRELELANEYLKKTLSYHRAIFHDLTNDTPPLEYAILEAMDVLEESQLKKEFIHNNLTVRGLIKQSDKGGLLFHVISYEQGVAASIIDSALSTTDVGTHESPPDKDYLQKEAFGYLVGNDLVSCNHNARDSLLLAFLKFVLFQAGKEHESETLLLTRIGNVDKLRLIENEGLKKINLNTSLYKASVDYVAGNNQNKVSGLFSSIAKALEGIKEGNAHGIAEDENLNVSVSISYDGVEARSHAADPKFGESGKKRLMLTAKEVLELEQDEYYDDFELVTGRGRLIKFNTLKVSEISRIKRVGTSLMRASAWEKLVNFFHKIQSNGILEE